MDQRGPEDAAQRDRDRRSAARANTSRRLGLPCVIRPAFTLGGRGGGIAHSEEQFERIVQRGLEASPIGQVLLDQSVIGWGEFELEVMRDGADNVVIVCSIENVDPMGVHTGDSVTVAPQQSLPDHLYQQLRDQAITVIRAVGVETGGSNVQFAVNPDTEEILVIEMNPRVSRSSALASKATGFPIAKIAARLAVGYRLDEIDNDITGVTPACFEPTIDYVVVKWPRFAFEKFPGADPTLTTHMKSVGEAMSFGRTFAQAFAKALRSRELDAACELDGVADDELLERLRAPAADRYEVLLEALRRGDAVEPRSARRPGSTRGSCASSRRYARDEDAPFAGERSFRSVDTCAAEFPARTPYYYSGWERRAVSEVAGNGRESVVILGSGPNRIGQGIEFDYCCVHAAMTVRESGRDAVMVNCNPETVSTDYDTSDRLYFEPLTYEDVLAVVEAEREAGTLKGVIVQFGGQTPLRARGGPRAGRRAAARHQRPGDRPRRGPRPLRRAARAARAARPRRTRRAPAPQDALERPRRSATRCWSALPTYSAAGRWRSSTTRGARRVPRARGRRLDAGEIFLDRFLEDSVEVDVDALCDGARGLDRRDHAARRGGRRALR